MAIIKSGWVLWPRIVMVLQPLTSQLWLSAVGCRPDSCTCLNTWPLADIRSATFGLLTMLLRYWMIISPCWLDVMLPTMIIHLHNMDKPCFDDQYRCALASSRRLMFGGQRIALWFTGKSLNTVKWERMKLTRRPCISLVSETLMVLWKPSPLISGGPLLSLLCSARVHHFLRLLMGLWTGVQVCW